MALSSATSEQCAVLTESRASKEENMLGGLRETATCISNHTRLVLLCDSQDSPSRSCCQHLRQAEICKHALYGTRPSTESADKGCTLPDRPS